MFRSILVALALLSLSISPPVMGEEKPTLEEKIEDSNPLSFEARPFDGKAKLKVTYLLMDKPYLAEQFSKGPNSLSIEDGKMTVLFDKEVHRLTLPSKSDGKLSHDKTFGKEGVEAYKKDKGWQPAETFDYGWFKSRPLGDGLIGRIEQQPFHHLVVTNKSGKEVVKLGTKQGKSKLCWLQNVCRWKDLVFIVDSNCRDIDVWTIGGKFLFEIDLIDLGPRYPWPMSIDITDDGVLYLGLTHEREKKEGNDNAGVTETFFMKITGLETIDANAYEAEED